MMGSSIDGKDVANCGLLFFAQSWLIEESGQGGSEIINERS